jgi:hypothetical protein
MPLGRYRKASLKLNRVGHISFWLVLMMGIYWEITDTMKGKLDLHYATGCCNLYK